MQTGLASVTEGSCVKEWSSGLRLNEWIKKTWYIYMMEYYATERKEELLPFVTAWRNWRALC